MMEETATISAEVAEVTARKSKTKIAPAPPDPRRAAAAAGAGKPAEISAAVKGTLRALAARPIVVAKKNGIANQATPPSTKAEGKEV